MNREELSRYVGVTGYSLGQVEKDYFQHIALGALSRRAAGSLVFKGGTALQKLGIIPRFSEDLDFTSSGAGRLEALKTVLLEAVRSHNHPVEADKEGESDQALSFRLKIQGVLFRNGHGACTLRVEISKREKVLEDPEPRELAPPYSDVLPYTMAFMRGEEMLAEKVRAIYTRQRARDLYDLDRMLTGGIPFKAGLANRKLSYYGKKFDPATFRERCQGLAGGWEAELGRLVVRVPPHAKAMETVRTHIVPG